MKLLNRNTFALLCTLVWLAMMHRGAAIYCNNTPYCSPINLPTELAVSQLLILFPIWAALFVVWKIMPKSNKFKPPKLTAKQRQAVFEMTGKKAR